MVSCNDRSGKLGECTVAPGVSQVVGRVYSNMFDTSGRQPDVKGQATNNPQRGRKNPQIAPSAVKYIMKAKHSCAYEQRPTPASGENNERPRELITSTTLFIGSTVAKPRFVTVVLNMGDN